jgi:hypothetical protein
MNFFGRKPSTKPGGPAANKHHVAHTKKQDGEVLDTLQQLRETQSNLEKRIEFLEKKKTTARQEAAAKLKKGDKTGATLSLKRSKMFEKEIINLGNALATLEAQQISIESAKVTSGVVQSMQAGKNAQQQLQKHLNVEDVAELQNDIQESLQLNDEVANVLGQSQDPLLDADVEQELKDWENDGLGELEVGEEEQEQQHVADTEKELADLEKSLMDAPVNAPTKKLPNAPKTSVAVPADNDDDDELKRLQAEFDS